MDLEKIAKVILSICSEYNLELKSNSDGEIILINGENEFCINDIATNYQVKVYKESKLEGAEFDIIELV